ncbi:DegT/DnrJ/EryC1/StrS family aminotransferase [Dehalococcoidia bacterium]|nr:DegT/DnrJ/EryC1/StrS family aminotransferase [Dehalococcoidia bacterium]
MSNRATTETLAINGGQPVRKEKMPARLAFGKDEAAQVMAAIEYYQEREQDPPYGGHFENQFCDAFTDFMGGGYADAVATGTAAVWVALAALDLPPKSEVIISPVTDSGPLNCIILQGFVPVLADSAPDSYNMGADEFLARVTPNTSAVLAVHCAGEPLDIERLVLEAHKRNIRVLEDPSQATGAVSNGQKVGTFGDIAAFSTMYRKNLTAGASGGIVYSKDLTTYQRALGRADRGKQPWREDLNPNDPGQAMFPSLNFNTDELSCAIGLASMRRLQDTIDKRVSFLSSVASLVEKESATCRPYALHEGFSPFFFPIFVDEEKLGCSKTTFAKAVAAEGIELNPHYGCVISSWDWAKPYLSDDFVTENALSTRDRSFNLHLNERYGEQEVLDTIAAIIKVEKYFQKFS